MTTTFGAAGGDATDPGLAPVSGEATPDAAAEATGGLEELDAAAFSALERIGRSVHSRSGDLQSTLEAVLSAAAETVVGARDAGLNLFIHGKFVPQAVFGNAPPELDAVQLQLGDGPCIAASRDQTVVHLPDLRTHSPWPEFAALADALGIRSVLCVPMWVDGSRVGSLSLYADQPHAFGEHETRVAALLATHAAIVIADARRVENLRIALDSRDQIGQAKGILMERHRITADQAFDLLVRSSQKVNKKLSEVAADFAATGELPS